MVTFFSDVSVTNTNSSMTRVHLGYSIHAPTFLPSVKTHLSLSLRAQELCESRGGRPGVPVPNTINQS